MSIVVLIMNSRLKTDVQSGLVTVSSCRRDSGRDVGSSTACGLEVKKDYMLRRDRSSAAQFVVPGICSILRLKTAVKNHKMRNRYDTVASLVVPF